MQPSAPSATPLTGGQRLPRDAPADGAAPAAPAFGIYAPTPVQRRIMTMFHGTVLGRTRLRRAAVRRFKAERPGPVDAHLFGLRVRFHPHDNQTDAKAAVCGPGYNWDELGWLRRRLAAGGTFVDVGANMGFFSLAALRQGAGVIAIEPLPAMFPRLAVNMALNGALSGASVQLFNEAAGDCAGHVDLAYQGRDYGSSTAMSGGAGVGGGGVGGDGVRVPMRPLADILAGAGAQGISLLKIDVEGFEDRVLCPFLRDAPRSLLPRAIILEHSSKEDWAADLLGDLARAGYVWTRRNRSNALLVRGAA